MCGIAGIFNSHAPDLSQRLEAMNLSQRHRGPDDSGLWLSSDAQTGLAQTRLSILDLSSAGHQPMWDSSGTLAIVFNGEIYNYLELRAELAGYPFQSQTDTEVVLAAFCKWGPECLHRFTGMFAFLLWDTTRQRLFAARDRFGVKPLYYHQAPTGTLYFASEIKALHAAGVPRSPDATTWSTWLTYGLNDHSTRTFWSGIQSLPGGHSLTFQNNRLTTNRWYNLPSVTGLDFDPRPAPVVQQEYRALLEESVRLRFRSDVPVGINLSGGLDSSTLLGLVHAVQGPDSSVKVFSFTTGDPDYDELPWVRQMLGRTQHPLHECRLTPAEVPALAESVSNSEDEPFGGLPTLAYAKLFETARREGVIVLLDGQGMDEQWAGYDYYSAPGDNRLVQGTSDRPVRPECLATEFAALAESLVPDQPYPDHLRNLQHRDAFATKIPRALRYNDRVSMRSSTELREPFLDHRLFEIAFRQEASRKISNGTRKLMLRRIAADLLPAGVVEAPKRPLQTPQREWLRGPLRPWAEERIEAAASLPWFQSAEIRTHWQRFLSGQSDNSFYVWQWLSAAKLAHN